MACRLSPLFGVLTRRPLLKQCCSEHLDHSSLAETGLGKSSVVWNGQGPDSPTVRTLATAAPQWTSFSFPLVILSFYRATGCHTQPRCSSIPHFYPLCSVLVFRPSSHSLCHCFFTQCFSEADTPVLWAIFGIWISPSSNALLKLAQYSGSEASGIIRGETVSSIGQIQKAKMPQSLVLVKYL